MDPPVADLERWLTGVSDPQVVVVEHPRLVTWLRQFGLSSICPLWQRQSPGIRFRDYEAFVKGDRLVKQSQVAFQTAAAWADTAVDAPTSGSAGTVGEHMCAHMFAAPFVRAPAVVSGPATPALTAAMLRTDCVRESLRRRRVVHVGSAEVARLCGETPAISLREGCALATASGAVVDLFAAGEVAGAAGTLPLALVFATLEGAPCVEELRELGALDAELGAALNDPNLLVGRYYCVIGPRATPIELDAGLCPSISEADALLRQRFTMASAVKYMHVQVGPEVVQDVTAQDGTAQDITAQPQSQDTDQNQTPKDGGFREGDSRQSDPQQGGAGWSDDGPSMEYGRLPGWAREMLVRTQDAFDRTPLKKNSVVALMEARPDACRHSLLYLDEIGVGEVGLPDSAEAERPRLPAQLSVIQAAWLKDHCYSTLIPARVDLYVRQISQQQTAKRTGLLGIRNQFRNLVGNETAPTRKTSNEVSLCVLYRRLGQSYYWRGEYLRSLMAYKQCLSELRAVKLRGVVGAFEESACASLMAAVQTATQHNKPKAVYLIGETSFVRDALTWLNEPTEDLPVPTLIRHRMLVGRIMSLLSLVQLSKAFQPTAIPSQTHVGVAIRYMELATDSYNEALTLFGTQDFAVTHLATAAISAHIYLLLCVVSYYLNLYHLKNTPDLNLPNQTTLSAILGLNRPMFPSSPDQSTPLTSYDNKQQVFTHHKTTRQRFLYMYMALKSLQFLNSKSHAHFHILI
ncbi:putative transmembrane protein [Gregarina niphandrodes]|uniref:Transmembrane protein n=1 Tax=Gregarina niphandrodes TaxID=110365 RepID=A0A023B3Y1_GRENI|nr:putative transmembrane protein [Gregarina niphandrodes]EZG55653.1 putative transmembrane protein [Gregarina niphandrodes]|eukprot:XP_011131472.1 putative transmembrane protein [Gregarina niphandrodes]